MADQRLPRVSSPEVVSGSASGSGSTGGTPPSGEGGVAQHHSQHFRRHAGLRETTDTAAAVVVCPGIGCVPLASSAGISPLAGSRLSATEACERRSPSGMTPSPTHAAARKASMGSASTWLAPEDATPVASVTLPNAETHRATAPSSRARRNSRRLSDARAPLPPPLCPRTLSPLSPSGLFTTVVSVPPAADEAVTGARAAPTVAAPAAALGPPGSSGSGADARFVQRRIPLPPPAVAPAGVRRSSNTLVMPTAVAATATPPSATACTTDVVPTSTVHSPPRLATHHAVVVPQRNRRHSLPPLPPTGPPDSSTPPPPSSPLDAAAAESQEREQAQMVRGLLGWGRGGRRNPFLKLAGTGEGHAGDLVPRTINTSRALHVLGGDDLREDVQQAEAPSELSRAALNIGPPTASTPKRARIDGAVDDNALEEEEALVVRRQESGHYHPSTAARSLSTNFPHTSTPDPMDSASFLRKAEASPKRTGGTPRRGPAQDRLSRTPVPLLQADSHGGSDSWSRGGATTATNSGRLTNTSTLTISYAPALSSFSTSSDSSMFL